MPVKRPRSFAVPLAMSFPRALPLVFVLACSASPADAPRVDDGGDGGGLVDAAEEVATDSAAGADSGVDVGPTDAAGYPAGPYGTAVGDTIADLALEGHVRFGETTGLASATPYAPTSFADLRARSPQKWAIVHVSGFT